MKIDNNNAADNLIRTGLEKLIKLNFTERIYKHDALLWKSGEEDVQIINNSLGWTEVYNWTLKNIGQIKTFAQEAKKDFHHIVLMGMGGSSLAPEVFRVLFGKQAGWPELLVLDSTNPDWIYDARAKIDPAKTLFIFASKSGGTVEPSSQFAYFYEEVSKVKSNAGSNFIAITDPGTGLETLAKEKSFRKIFLNKADIGGRFSALSLFGMLPAALIGLDAELLIKTAKAQGDAFKTDAENAAAKLGALMGEGYLSGKDKLTILTSQEIKTLGLWIEQLVAESTGKDGKGVVPVSGEALYLADSYKNDRIFVHLSLEGKTDLKVQAVVEQLRESGHPFMQIEMKNMTELCAHMLLWEVATAATGAIMEINPFDQPNVQAAKTIAKGLLNDLDSGKISPESTAELLLSSNLKGAVNLQTLGADIKKITKDGDYIALLAYVNSTSDTDREFEIIRKKIFFAATEFGYGPRYLHSTGQLHKGDGNHGIFIIFSADCEHDINIPGQSYTFGGLVHAQALADFKALEEKGRRVLKIHLKKGIKESLKKISDAV